MIWPKSRRPHSHPFTVETRRVPLDNTAGRGFGARLLGYAALTHSQDGRYHSLWQPASQEQEPTGDGLWDSPLWQLGDWLNLNEPPSNPGLTRTDGVLVADAYLVHVTSVMADIASVLGLAAESDHFRKEGVRLKSVFHDRYIAKSGLVVNDSQTSLALRIVFGLHDNDQQPQCAAGRLARLVRFAKFGVSTSFAGTPVVLDVRSKGANTQTAYRMLLENSCPSWRYPVNKGATTIWERWDNMLDDGSINPGAMTSSNHYALGSVAHWLHSTVGGIMPVEPGWKTFHVNPRPGGTITSANVTFLSPNGRIEFSWKLSGQGQLGWSAARTAQHQSTD